MFEAHRESIFVSGPSSGLIQPLPKNIQKWHILANFSRPQESVRNLIRFSPEQKQLCSYEESPLALTSDLTIPDGQQ